jgi:hypothetical protein
MNLTDLQILEAIRKTVAGVPAVRLARLVRPGEEVEVPLSRMAAVLVEPVGAESLEWPDVPVARYRLLRWRLSVVDRAVPGTRAFEALASVAEACRAAVAASPTLGGLAEDGPPLQSNSDLAPATGASRMCPPFLAGTEPGRPTALVIEGATGRWTDLAVGAATIDGESLFASGPHVVVAGSPAERVSDQVFNGLSGGATLDLGFAGRTILQTGVLTAASAQSLAIIEAAIEAFVDGRAYTLMTPGGTQYPHCRLESLERLGPPRAASRWQQPYRITYRQISR